jgi:hypothetical protein
VESDPTSGIMVSRSGPAEVLADHVTAACVRRQFATGWTYSQPTEILWFIKNLPPHIAVFLSGTLQL